MVERGRAGSGRLPGIAFLRGRPGGPIRGVVPINLTLMVQSVLPSRARIGTDPTAGDPPIRELSRMSDIATARKKLYIETVGCQMNLLDSELVVGKLRSEGYELTDDINQADTILYNTCSVRQHAEDKIYSALGRVRRLKEQKPELTIGVLGCMAQKDQGKILRRAPHVDLTLPPTPPPPGPLQRMAHHRLD